MSLIKKGKKTFKNCVLSSLITVPTGGHNNADTNVSMFARVRNSCGNKICVRDTENVSDFFKKYFCPLQMFSDLCSMETKHLFDSSLFVHPREIMGKSLRNVSFLFLTDFSLADESARSSPLCLRHKVQYFFDARIFKWYICKRLNKYIISLLLV